jgi:ATP-dependent DNA ligase
MKLVYPDKPMEDVKESLPRYEEEKCWRAQSKLDGWRTLVARDKNQTIADPTWAQGKDNSLFFLSRRDGKKGGPTRIPVSQGIIEAIEALNLPDKSMLDGEWMARRTIGECPEKLFLFDVLWFNDKWFGDLTFFKRDEFLTSIVKASEPSVPVHTREHVPMPAQAKESFAELFKYVQAVPYTEGIVLKHLDSKIKGDIDGCVKNALWAKIKWRSGSSGRDIVL